MSYSDEEKRGKSISYIIEKLNTLDTLEKYNIFVNKISSDVLITIVKDGFKSEGVKTDFEIASLQEKKLNDSEMEI